MLCLKDVIVSGMNVRNQDYSETDVSDLLESIKEKGLLSKIILRKKNGSIEIIAGSRRFRALKELRGPEGSLSDSEVIIFEDMSDIDALCLSIHENQKRRALAPFELNKAALTLNSSGKKDKEIAEILSITPHRLKRIYQLSADKNRMPEEIRQELNKTGSVFNDLHWEKMSHIEAPEVVKDVFDQIMEKEIPPRDVPTIVKAIEKQFEKDNPPLGDENTKPAKTSVEQSDLEEHMEYAHKGELKLEIYGDRSILKVIGKGEDEEVPVETYLEYLRHPEKFRCFVTFKLKIKPVG